ncbi:hypothetical protein TNCV_2267611 [Trichonephila clavipes]|nr:hypothetical protein TNCV_2267611 [Trichonephila clavipes]
MRLPNCCVMHCHSGPALSIMAWGGFGFYCYTPIVRITGTLNSQHYISEMLEPWFSHTISTCHQLYSNWILRETRNTSVSQTMLLDLVGKDLERIFDPKEARRKINRKHDEPAIMFNSSFLPSD